MTVDNRATDGAPRVISPMPTGSGAIIVHRTLEKHLENYQVQPYSPLRTLFPPSLWRVGRDAPAEIVHATPDHALFFDRPGVPLVLTFQNYVLDRGMRPFSSFAQRVHYATDLAWFTRLSVDRAAVLTAASQATARLAREELRIERPIEVIPNGVDLELFTPREAPRPADGEIKVFFAGNLTRRKGAHWLPEIAQRLPGHINIYYTQGLRTRSALPEHPRLRPLGRIPYQQMPERYRQMDILLIPTVREGLCLAVLEAMASGLPVVATDASSLPEQIVEDRGGHLCPIGDSEAFANRVQLLADDPQARLDMGIFNRRRAEERFGLASMLEAYRRVFQRAVGKA